MLGFALHFIGFSPVSGAIDTTYILSFLAQLGIHGAKK
jgi:hypothetical protein